MNCRITDLRDKEVINIKNGCKIGCVDDAEINTASAEVVAIVVFGRRRWFGLFGRDEDICIPWSKIEVIGEDAVLVCLDGTGPGPRGRFRRGLLKTLLEP